MLQTINAPITMFIEYVNTNYPTHEDVVIFSVDEEMEKQENVLGTDSGDAYLGRYWRQGEEPHVILIKKELDIHDSIWVLAHEYVHHYSWTNSMLDMKDTEVHELEGFSDLWEEIAEGCIAYITAKGYKYGFYDLE